MTPPTPRPVSSLFSSLTSEAGLGLGFDKLGKVYFRALVVWDQHLKAEAVFARALGHPVWYPFLDTILGTP